MNVRVSGSRADRQEVWVGGARPPTVEAPWWRGPDGERRSFSYVLTALPEADHPRLVSAHAGAIGELVEAAGYARLLGDHPEARRLAANASRLCGELVGLWPAGSWEH